MSSAKVGEDGEAVGELTEYKTHWRALVDEEWAEEQRIVNERLQWPLRRLEAEGLAVANVWARKNGTFFGDPIVKFSRGDGQLLPRHSFQLPGLSRWTCTEKA